MCVIHKNISLKKFNSFGLDVKAKYYIKLSDQQQVIDFIKSDLSNIRPIFVIGEGSNVLFSKDFNGLLVHPKISGIKKTEETKEHVKLRVGAGENWDEFVNSCVQNNYGGIENLSLIPGSVGACPIQNIEAYGVEVREVIESVEAVEIETADVKIFSNEECKFYYRNSIFKQQLKNKYIITHVNFRFEKKYRIRTSYGDIEKELNKFPETNIQNIRKVIINIRNSKLPDPKELGNAGSFFLNPVVKTEEANSLKQYYPRMPFFMVSDDKVKLSAAWLIEQSNWKGKRVGDAGTYKKQPLVIVNYGNASGKDILNIANKIRKAVKNNFAIDLEMEVNVV
jgi:UDP-N-acetylmuramate dehydrogenase